MEKYVKLFFCLAGIIILMSCADEEFPVGLYDYQVERLLAGDEGKLWINAEEGSEPVFYRIFNENDSLTLLSLSNTLLDTMSRQRAKATGLELAFTDSIVFANQEKIWLVEDIRNDRFQFRRVNPDGSTKDNLFLLQQ